VRTTVAKNGVVKLWDVSTGTERATLKVHGVHCVAFAPNSMTLATGGQDRTVRVWDVQTMEERAALKGHTDAIAAVSFNRDGRILASTGADKTIRLWQLQK
jgi:WD40 repeat protein